MAAVVVQYIIVRKDLRTVLKWPLGALIAQCCHASTAVINLHKDDEETKLYLEDMDNMHKIVLESRDEAELVELAKVLKDNDIKHKLWIEQPENIPTCLAIKPYGKEQVQKFVKKFKLLKD